MERLDRRLEIERGVREPSPEIMGMHGVNLK
jgi:hypothetical protein